MGVPVLIELRQVSKDRPILDFILNEVNPLQQEFDKDFLIALISRGDFIFFLDGFDEIPFAERDSVIKALQDFISKANANQFILSSRPDEALPSFTDFKQFTIKPLTTDEAFSLIKKCDPVGNVADALLKKLKGSTLTNVHEFLTNPLLVSLLYKSFEHKPTVPLRKPIFYRQVYDALYETHDLSKPGAYVRQKHSKLDLEDFHKVLRAIGFITVKVGKIEYSKDEIIQNIKEARSQCVGLDFAEADFLKDLTGTVPLFIETGLFFKWGHKSIQDYFCAQFICSDTKVNQAQIMMAMANGQRVAAYINILDLCYDIDYKTFRHNIIKDFLIKYIKHLENVQSAFVGLQITQAQVDNRVSLIYLKRIIVFKAEHLGLGHLAPDKFLQIAYEEIRKLIEKNKMLPEHYNVRSGYGTGRCYTVLYEHTANNLVRLLASKGEPIGQEYTSQSSALIPPELAGSPTLIILDEDPSKPWNSPEKFDSTSHLAVSSGANSTFKWDYAACLDMLKAIEGEISSEASSGFF
jgi:hypothetical protein